MAHSEYPYKFDNVILPFMSTWQESFERVTNDQVSEAGTDLEIVVRRGKLTVNGGCGCFSDMKKTLQEFYNLDSFVLSRYDDIEEDYTMHNVRMTAFSADRIYKSEDVSNTVGLWKVSFILKEF